jgi:hypothetical protein
VCEFRRAKKCEVKKVWVLRWGECESDLGADFISWVAKTAYEALLRNLGRTFRFRLMQTIAPRYSSLAVNIVARSANCYSPPRTR